MGDAEVRLPASASYAEPPQHTSGWAVEGAPHSVSPSHYQATLTNAATGQRLLLDMRQYQGAVVRMQINEEKYPAPLLP
jgi:hypothetical protein